MAQFGAGWEDSDLLPQCWDQRRCWEDLPPHRVRTHTRARTHALTHTHSHTRFLELPLPGASHPCLWAEPSRCRAGQAAGGGGDLHAVPSARAPEATYLHRDSPGRVGFNATVSLGTFEPCFLSPGENIPASLTDQVAVGPHQAFVSESRGPARNRLT